MLKAYLIAVAIKSTAVLLAGVLGVRLLRGRDAAVRHFICLAALASAAAVPLLALWSPQWSFLISVPAGAGAGEAGNGVGASLAIWPMVLPLIWAAGVLVMTIRAACGWTVLLRARRASVRFNDQDGTEVRMGNVSTPLTCGVLRPMILLPQAARDWDELRLRAVLLHESAHLRRRDCLAKYAALGVRAVLWWNPLAWILAARMNREQELACDALVLASGVPADSYATMLMDLMRECSRPLVFGCAMVGGSALRERFEHLFQERCVSGIRTRRMPIVIPLLLVLLTTVSFAEKIYKIGPGIVPPKVLEKHEPNYTHEARAAKIQGPVLLTIVVGRDQRAHDIKVTKSLDRGLDASAVASIKTWRFQPGTKNGKAVQVRAKVEVNFRLH
jgi:TonB family protein